MSDAAVDGAQGLPETGFVRQSQLIPGILPFSPSTLWRLVKAGKFTGPGPARRPHHSLARARGPTWIASQTSNRNVAATRGAHPAPQTNAPCTNSRIEHTANNGDLAMSDTFQEQSTLVGDRQLPANQSVVEAAAPYVHLIKYDSACRALAEVSSVDEVKDILDRAVKLKLYGKIAENKQLERDAVALRLRAERRLGEMMAEQGEVSARRRAVPRKASVGVGMRVLTKPAFRHRHWTKQVSAKIWRIVPASWQGCRRENSRKSCRNAERRPRLFGHQACGQT